MTDNGLSDDDREHLRYISEHGVKAYDANGHEPDTTPVTCHHCDYRWYYTGEKARACCPKCTLRTRTGLGPVGQDGRGITIEMCNAIRAAAEDGKTYREIADLFSFVNDPTGVNRHAVGECSHGSVDYPPQPSQRDPGPVNAVNDAECAELNRLYDRGESVNDLADATGRSKSTVYRHVSGECSHG